MTLFSCPLDKWLTHRMTQSFPFQAFSATATFIFSFAIVAIFTIFAIFVIFAFFAIFGQQVCKMGGRRRELDGGYIARNNMGGATSSRQVLAI